MPEQATLKLCCPKCGEVVGEVTGALPQLDPPRAPESPQVVRAPGGQLSIQQVQAFVARRHEITVERMLSRDRHRSVMMVRKTAVYLCRRLTGASYPEIGRAFRHCDHTTAMSNFRSVETTMQRSQSFRAAVAEMIEELSGAAMPAQRNGDEAVSNDNG